MPTIADIRKQFPTLDNLNDFEIADIYAKGEGVSPETAWYELGMKAPNTPGAWSTVKRSAAQFAGGVGEIGGDLTGSPDSALTRWADNVEAYNPSGINSLGDIVDKPGLAVAEAVGNAATFLVPGGALRRDRSRPRPPHHCQLRLGRDGEHAGLWALPSGT